MFYWIYDIPTWQLATYFTILFVGTTWLGILLVSPILKLWFRSQEGINDIVGYALSAFGVFYGLLLGLLAVATYQNAADVQAKVAREASSLAALYRNVFVYPEPLRSDLHRRLVEYGQFTIDVAWPAQKKGIVAPGAFKMINEFQAALVQFEPQTKTQEIMHAETLRQFTKMIELRRERIDSINTGIPGIMWYVVAVGAVINTLIILCFRVRFDIHLVIGGVLSFFIGVVIFLIAAMDNPFRGEVSAGPDSFQVLIDSLKRE